MYYLLGYKLFGQETYALHEFLQSMSSDEKEATLRFVELTQSRVVR